MARKRRRREVSLHLRATDQLRKSHQKLRTNLPGRGLHLENVRVIARTKIAKIASALPHGSDRRLETAQEKHQRNGTNRKGAHLNALSPGVPNQENEMHQRSETPRKSGHRLERNHLPESAILPESEMPRKNASLQGKSHGEKILAPDDLAHEKRPKLESIVDLAPGNARLLRKDQRLENEVVRRNDLGKRGLRLESKIRGGLQQIGNDLLPKSVDPHVRDVGHQRTEDLVRRSEHLPESVPGIALDLGSGTPRESDRHPRNALPLESDRNLHREAVRESVQSLFPCSAQTS
mmetsp:Transcript_102674/g.162282  ORF Transcript_102674/g.162282 Transcript_102674/m.162282 type:complete len:292 (-) Transcript_102674:799-1674(-)